VHTLSQFVEQALELEAMGCDSIAIKDMAGLLTPAAAEALVSQLVSRLRVPVHLHTHATSGLAAMCHLKAIEAGCRHVDTAISAFAGGASHPPTESLVAALRDTPWDTGLDLELLQEIGAHFAEVRRRYRRFESEWTGVDTRVHVTQVPVTPTSQIVGTQAVLNVLTGERYKTVTSEVKAYLLGRYGRPPGPVNPAVRRLAIGDETPIECRPADLLDEELESLREQVADLARSEEDVLSYAMFPEVAREFLQARNTGTLRPEPLEEPPAGAAGPGEDGGAPVEFNVTLHGETYHVRITGTGHPSQERRPFYVTVDGVPEEILVEIEPEGGDA